MEIVSKGHKWREVIGWRCKCFRCGCVVEYESKEVKDVYGRIFICPRCGKSERMGVFNSRRIWGEKE